MPIVRKPLLQRLADASKGAIETYQNRKRASGIRALLAGSEDPSISMLADFVDPSTGEVGALGNNLLNLAYQDRRIKAQNQEAYNRIDYQMKYQREKEDRDAIYAAKTFENKQIQDLIPKMDNTVTYGKGGKIKSEKLGLLDANYNIAPGTVSPADKYRLAQTIVRGGQMPVIIPGQEERKAKPFVNKALDLALMTGSLGAFKPDPWEAQSYKQTQFIYPEQFPQTGSSSVVPGSTDWNKFYNYP